MLNIGEVLDNKYRIVSLLGKGGMGHVYLAENIKLGNKWAIKEISASDDRKKVIHFESEILKRLNHHSLPRIVDLIEYGNKLYMVEDYFEGTNLKELIKTRGSCREDEVLKWAVQLCDILSYLHSFEPNPIIYRDMKPGNVIIDNGGGARLVDLGIAREYREENDSDTVYIGTRGYAAPEQFAGLQQTDERTDIYGLGATLYHALTGLSPNSPPYVIMPVRQINSALSADIGEIIAKCTQNDPDLRYQNTGELMDDLNRILNKKISYSTKPGDERYRATAVRLAVIGSLSQRAGSSFIAANLASAIADRRIPTAVIELPVNIPYLYDALFMGRKTAGDFCSWPHEIAGGNLIDRRKSYVEGEVTWIVTDPSLPQIEAWSDQNMMKLLQAVRQFPVVIVDVSSNWHHPSVELLLAQADQVLLVIDPDPVLVDRMAQKHDKAEWQPETGTQENKIIRLLTEADKRYGNLDLIINKYTEGCSPDRIGLPVEPAALFPFIDPVKVYKCLWDGEIPYRRPELKGIFDDSLAAVIEKLIPGDRSYGDLLAKEGLMGRIKAVYRLLTGEWGREY